MCLRHVLSVFVAAEFPLKLGQGAKCACLRQLSVLLSVLQLLQSFAVAIHSGFAVRIHSGSVKTCFLGAIRCICFEDHHPSPLPNPKKKTGDSVTVSTKSIERSASGESCWEISSAFSGLQQKRTVVCVCVCVCAPDSVTRAPMNASGSRHLGDGKGKGLGKGRRGRPTRTAAIARAALEESGRLKSWTSASVASTKSVASSSRRRAQRSQQTSKPSEASRASHEETAPPTTYDVPDLSSDLQIAMIERALTSMPLTCMSLADRILAVDGVAYHSKMQRVVNKSVRVDSSSLQRPVTNAETLEVQPSTLAIASELTASLVHFLAKASFQKLVLAVGIAANHHHWKGLLCVAELAWDETPQKLRLAPFPGSTTKIMQRTLTYHILMRLPGGQRVLLHLPIPMPLAAVSRNTAECTLAVLEQTLGDIDYDSTTPL